ncbi:hypothetical protein [Burkholderia pyrrocinia]|uniref:hypothetical protein n=1 Tax=Burkholderia pyrrocinia TaxID=60550 RepID=UPI002AB2D488|nr:hypothetical protein [Burkholderia pyrrocinia]
MTTNTYGGYTVVQLRQFITDHFDPEHGGNTIDEIAGDDSASVKILRDLLDAIEPQQDGDLLRPIARWVYNAVRVNLDLLHGICGEFGCTPGEDVATWLRSRLTIQSEKSPAPELASGATDQRPETERTLTEVSPATDGIVDARAVGSNVTSSKVSRADALTRESVETIARKYAGAYFTGLLFQDADSFGRFSDEVIAAASPVEQPAAAQIGDRKYTQADMERYGKAYADARDARRVASSQPAASPTVIDAIAAQWDGCMYPGIGHDINIGVAIRDAAKLLGAPIDEQPAAAPVEAKIAGYRWRWPNSLSPNRWSADMRDNQDAYCRTMVEEMSARGAVAELVYSAPAPSTADDLIHLTDEQIERNRKSVREWWARRDAAQPAPSPADERAAFEYHERASNLERDDEGDYVNPCVQSAWEGWQARAASANETGAEGALIGRLKLLLSGDAAFCKTTVARSAIEQAIAALSRSPAVAIQPVAAWAHRDDPRDCISDEKKRDMIAHAGAPGARMAENYSIPLGRLGALPAMATQPVRAWETDDGRVISDEQKQQALRDGGASASSVRPFSIALGRIEAVPAMAAEAAVIPAGCVLIAEADLESYVHPQYGPGVFCTEDCLSKPAAPQPAQADARVGLTATHFVAKYGNGSLEYSTCIDGFDQDWAETRGGVEIVGLAEIDGALLQGANRE